MAGLIARARANAGRNGWAHVMRRGIEIPFVRVFGKRIMGGVTKRFELRAAQIETVDETVDLAFSFRSRGVFIRPIQIREEILELSRAVADLKPKVVLEIGTAGGGTLFIFTKLSDPSATVASVDLPGGEFGGGYPTSMEPLLKSFVSGTQRIILIRDDSHKQETAEKVTRSLGGAPLDFLFIDGDHTYEGVKRDFELYAPMVGKGGMIALHDICPTMGGTVGVPRLWSELKNRYRHVELIKDINQGWGGIGVLYA